MTRETTQGRVDRELLLGDERNTERLATDPHYFARPDRTIFRDIRHLFSLADQAYVLARGVGALPGCPGGGRPRVRGTEPSCQAFTRQGTPCQREPKPGSNFCTLLHPRHLEADWEEPAVDGAPRPALAAA